MKISKVYYVKFIKDLCGKVLYTIKNEFSYTERANSKQDIQPPIFYEIMFLIISKMKN